MTLNPQKLPENQNVGKPVDIVFYLNDNNYLKYIIKQTLKTKIMNPQTQFEMITPKKAEKILEFNKNNRPVNEKNLDFITKAMQKNDFHLTGESIKIAEDGTLIDGQHRLMAIIKSGTTQKMLVLRGLSNEAFKYIDTGRNRSAGDVLAIEGVQNSNAVAAISLFIINFKRGRFIGTRHITRREKVTNSEISEFVNKNKADILESFKYGHNKYNKVLSKNILSAFHYIFDKINQVQADEFCHKLADGSDLKQTSPIYLLRQKLISDIRSTRKMPPIEKNALVCKAWNAYRTGKTLTVLKWDSVKEPFPKPI